MFFGLRSEFSLVFFGSWCEFRSSMSGGGLKCVGLRRMARVW